MEIFQLSHWSLTSHGTFVVKCQFSALELCKQDQPHQRSITHQAPDRTQRQSGPAELSQ